MSVHRPPHRLKWDEIPKFTGTPTYRVNINWSFLEDALKQYRVELNPDFQRVHVWTEEQQRAYIEFRLRDGGSGKDIFLNNPHINRPVDDDEDYAVCVDGKQRITATLAFLRDELTVFGGYRASEIDGFRRIGRETEFVFHINSLKTRAEVLRWYLELNRGGVLHTPEELNRVAELLDAELAEESRS